jgi:hypothetical protein
MALGAGAQAQDEINVLAPATDSIVSPLSGPSVSFVPSLGLSSFQVQFSADGSFGLGNDTVSFPRLSGVAGSPLGVDDRAWKRVVGKAVENSAVMFFRVRALGSGGVVTSTPRRIFISSASAEGVVDLLMRRESVREGDVFSVAVLVNTGVTELGGVSMKVRRNPAVLQFLGGLGGVVGPPFFDYVDVGDGTIFLSLMNMPQVEPTAQGLVEVGKLLFRVASGAAGGAVGVSGSVLSIATRDLPPVSMGAETPRPTVGGGTLGVLGG